MTKGDQGLANYPEEEREAYLGLVASLAGVDGEVSDEEIGKLRELCKRAKLGPHALGEVIGVAEDPRSAPLGEYVERLKTSDLRYSLITDLYALAAADDSVSEQEKREIADMAEVLGVENQQREAIQGFTEHHHERRRRERDDGGNYGGDYGSRGDQNASTQGISQTGDTNWASLFGGGSSGTSGATSGGGWASALSSVGVPVAAVAAAGLLGGTGGAGLAGGAVALAQGKGFGGAVKNAAVGAVGFAGARWLLKKLF